MTNKKQFYLHVVPGGDKARLSVSRAPYTRGYVRRERALQSFRGLRDFNNLHGGQV